jgi:hypothetical protein
VVAEAAEALVVLMAEAAGFLASLAEEGASVAPMAAEALVVLMSETAGFLAFLAEEEASAAPMAAALVTLEVAAGEEEGAQAVTPAA